MYRHIREKLGFEKDLPYTENWSAAPDFAEIIIEYCLKNQPSTVIECSSGLTTLVLARCCQLNAKGRVFTLEDGAEYADRTRRELKEFGLEQYVDVIDAPLQEIAINDSTYLWYEVSALPEVSIDMLVIDGPSGFIQKHSRYPAVPLLFNHFSEQCSVFLDDAAREDEKRIVEMWLAENPAMVHEYLKTERGCSKLMLSIE